MASRLARHILPVTLWLGIAVWSAGEIQGSGAPFPDAPQGGAQQSVGEQQIERGRGAVTQTCVGCHAGILRMLESREKTEAEWRDTVYSMIGRGAQILPDEIEPITAYLVSVAGPGRRQQAARSRPDAAPSPATPGSDPQAADATAILSQRCALCHDTATATRRPPSETWAGVIDRMIALGASVTPAERQILVDYLTELEQ
jgi:cytochrome c5